MIGNRERFGIDLMPVVPHWELRYEPEAAGWAGLAIWIFGWNVCRHVEPGTSEFREHLFVPLGPIADWFVESFGALQYEERARLFPTSRALHDDVSRWGRTPSRHGLDADAWIDERESWWQRHFLRAGAGGAVLPNLAIVRDDEQMVLSWATPPFSDPLAPVMVWPEGDANLPWDEGFEVLSTFTAAVAEAFRETGHGAVYPWTELESPLDAAALPLESAVEFYTARTIEELIAVTRANSPDEALRAVGLTPESVDPAQSATCQMFRDLSVELAPDVGEAVVEAGRCIAEAGVGTARWLAARDSALDAARAGASPELSGQLAANEVRRRAGLDGNPVTDADALLTQLGITPNRPEVDGAADRMVVAGDFHGSAAVTPFRTPRTDTTWGLRFEYSRGLGHLLLDATRFGAIGAASGPLAPAARRRRSGAFAAELLLPRAALVRASGEELDGITRGEAFASLLARYGVGARTAAWQLWNHDLLSSPTVRDDLIDRHR